ncbi:DUF423 domain-containing protein [Mangrovimonas sp. CR14]|uniref:DUF423 domain-containing protein n=1 Tax=Mangrovimonas sp. CR14 TaxID=2706120 RepID=UPI001420AE74|nr:DUF423 domain-containing protein [Mangrovimonas sp. CR14]NIK91637.1 DUF423 domain-containing protein [Mangrovimonas sp. CR14]
MNQKILITGALFGILSVALGAFGAHGLKAVLSPEQLTTFETGVRYQMYHAILLLFVGGTNILEVKTKKTIFILILVGIIFFSGSIYGLATNEMSAFNFKTIALITPVGGSALIAAWVVMLVGFIKKSQV